MSVDTTFKPIGKTVVAGAAGAAVQPNDSSASAGVTTFRIRCTTGGYLTWGASGIAAATAPTTGTPQTNTLGFAAGVAYIEAPAASFFRSDATGVFEITGGMGGTGG